MSDQDKPPPVGYEWWVVDGKLQLVAISPRANAKMLRQEAITSGLVQLAAERARLVAENEQLRAELEQARRATGEDIVRNYYLAKRTNRKLSLRKYLQNLGIPEREGYIRKVKVAYDKHKRGRR